MKVQFRTLAFEYVSLVISFDSSQLVNTGGASSEILLVHVLPEHSDAVKALLLSESPVFAVEVSSSLSVPIRVTADAAQLKEVILSLSSLDFSL
jgi:hypothetical protein